MGTKDSPGVLSEVHNARLEAGTKKRSREALDNPVFKPISCPRQGNAKSQLATAEKVNFEHGKLQKDNFNAEN